MLSKVIGIISYLPENIEIRNIRIKKLNTLLKKCNELFNLPVIIIAQNWNEDEIQLFENIDVKKYPKLGIATARETLRKEFINSNYDYLIMLDDDCELQGNKEGALKYLTTIDEHPEGYGCFRASLLNLFAISKSLYKQVSFPIINPELGEGFEDRCFVHGLLETNYRSLKYTFKDSSQLTYKAIVTKDPNSTWYKQQDLTMMNEKTYKFISDNKLKETKKIDGNSSFSGWRW